MPPISSSYCLRRSSTRRRNASISAHQRHLPKSRKRVNGSTPRSVRHSSGWSHISILISVSFSAQPNNPKPPTPAPPPPPPTTPSPAPAHHSTGSSFLNPPPPVDVRFHQSVTGLFPRPRTPRLPVFRDRASSKSVSTVTSVHGAHRDFYSCLNPPCRRRRADRRDLGRPRVRRSSPATRHRRCPAPGTADAKYTPETRGAATEGSIGFR